MIYIHVFVMNMFNVDFATLQKATVSFPKCFCCENGLCNVNYDDPFTLFERGGMLFHYFSVLGNFMTMNWKRIFRRIYILRIEH